MASQVMPAAIESPLVVASNRGPVSFRRDEGGALVGERGPGGLVTALASVLFESDATWLAAAQSDVDRELAASGKQIEVEPMGHAGFIDPPADRYDGYYNGISNRVLWLLHHYLFDLAYLPAWDMETRQIWQDYREINRLFAESLHREEGRNPVFLIQDYHLSLVPQYLRELQPDARITHFSHTPFCGPTYLRLLPAQMREDLLRGMLGADVLGFQAERWVVNFLLGVRDSLPEARVDVRRRRVDIDGRQVRVRAYPIALDPAPLRRTAASADVKQLRKKLGAWRGDAKLLLRVDRLELSKNIVRGYQAYELFLRDHPEWRGRVRFLSLLPRSRTEIPEYVAYAERCLETAAKINEELGTPDWTPIEIRTEEDYPQAVAAYGLYDVLMVNPVFDGMNLVAMEGPLVNRRNGALILSSNAGAHGRLGSHAITVNPFDLAEMADAIRVGLEMPEEERIRRERGLVRAVLASSPGRWLTSQLRDLDGVRGVTSREGLEGLEQMDERAGAGEDLVGSGDEVGRDFGAGDGNPPHRDA
jgi:trehalose 6-phosphate synthase